MSAVVTLLERYGLEERCVISSGSYTQLERVKELNSKIRTGYILSLVYGEIFNLRRVSIHGASIKRSAVVYATN